MARSLFSLNSIPGVPTPYIGTWSGTIDADSRKVSNGDPDGPYDVTENVGDSGGRCGGLALNMQLDAAGSSMVLELICVRNDSTAQGQVVYAQSITVTTGAAARRTAQDNASGYYLAVDSTTGRLPIFDLRGTTFGNSGGLHSWFLCAVSITTATAARLIELKPVEVV